MGLNYRPVKSDPEYIDNWVGSLNLLCKDRHNIGFLGSSYFIGMITSMYVISALSDMYGRKIMYCLCMIVSVISQIGLI